MFHPHLMVPFMANETGYESRANLSQAKKIMSIKRAQFGQLDRDTHSCENPVEDECKKVSSAWLSELGQGEDVIFFCPSQISVRLKLEENEPVKVSPKVHVSGLQIALTGTH